MAFLQPDQRQTLLWASLGVGLCVLLYSLSAVLTPFLFAAILGYILNPGVDWLTRHRWPRWLAVLLAIVALCALAIVLILIIVPVMQREIGQLQQRFPELLTRLNAFVAPRLRDWFGVHIQFTGYSLRKMISDNWADQDMISTVLASLKVGGLAVIGMAAMVFMVPMVLFYLLLDWSTLVARLDNAVPRRWHAKTLEIAREIDALLAQFLRGQVLVMLLLAVYYSLALSLAGFDVALPVGIFTGLLVFVPYLGYAVGLALAVLTALLQFTDWSGLIWVAVIYGIGQFVESFILTPRLVGERIGLHPLAVIFALLAFGQLFGFFGVLLALPASAALAVGLRHIKTLYLASAFYRGNV